MSRISFRRRGQSTVETSMLLIPLMAFVMVVAAATVYAYQGWVLGQAASYGGDSLTRAGIFDEAGMRAKAQSLGVELGVNDDLTIAVTTTGTPACGAPADNTCSYSWGEYPSMAYSDWVRVELTRSDPGGLFDILPLPSLSATWFGLAQRDTIEGGYSQPGTTGNLTIETADSSSAPLAGVDITMTGIGSGISDSNGSYTFNDVEVGSYAISASKTGYETTQTIAMVQAGLSLTVTIVLDDAALFVVFLSDEAVNLLTDNPGFEAGGTSSWSSAASAFTSSPTSFDSVLTPVVAGSHAGRFVTDSSAATLNEGVRTMLPVVSDGETYLGTVWVRSDSGTPLEVVLGSLAGTYTTVGLTANGGWQSLDVSWTSDGAWSDVVLAVRDARGAGSNGSALTVYLDAAVVRSSSHALSGVVTINSNAATQVATGEYQIALNSGSYDILAFVDGCNDNEPWDNNGNQVAGGAGEAVLIEAVLTCD